MTSKIEEAIERIGKMIANPPMLSFYGTTTHRIIDDLRILISAVSARGVADGWRIIETAEMWEPVIVTDGENVAISVKSESDYGGHYWAVDPEDALEWEPTHWIAFPLTIGCGGGHEAPRTLADAIQRISRVQLQNAVGEVLRQAYYLLDDTANENPPEVPQESWDNLSNAVSVLEAMIPASERPCNIGVAARLLAAPSSPAATSEVEREAIARAIGQADSSFGYTFNMTKLVDGVATHTLTMPGYDPEHFEDRDDGYRLIEERRNRVRADAILALFRTPPAPAGEECSLCGAVYPASHDIFCRNWAPPMADQIHKSTGRPESTGQEPGSADTTAIRVCDGPNVGPADIPEQVFAPAGCDGPVDISYTTGFIAGRDAAAGVAEEIGRAWHRKAQSYRKAGNNGPYLGEPSGFSIATAIRAIEAPN